MSINQPNQINQRPQTVNELVAATGWQLLEPKQNYLQNMAIAWKFFFANFPPSFLWTPRYDSPPWVLKINGVPYRVVSWMQAINFSKPVIGDRIIDRGDEVDSYRNPIEKAGTIQGNWFTFPLTHVKDLANYSGTYTLHKFKAATDFTCLESTVSDAYCDWLPDRAPQYRHGGGQQLFIANPRIVLQPIPAEPVQTGLKAGAA